MISYGLLLNVILTLAVRWKTPFGAQTPGSYPRSSIKVGHIFINHFLQSVHYGFINIMQLIIIHEKAKQRFRNVTHVKRINLQYSKSSNSLILSKLLCFVALPLPIMHLLTEHYEVLEFWHWKSDTTTQKVEGVSKVTPFKHLYSSY